MTDSSVPDIFNQLGINARVAEELRRAAAAARAGSASSAMTHAWLFTGPPGSGRSVAALAFAAALECTGPVPGCGRCEACTKVGRDAHTDVVHIIPRELSIGVEMMRREVIEPAAGLPTVGRWRIVILDDADRLTEQSANALLKTVEEPPARTVIILCAPSPDDIIPTLFSRSRHIYVPQPTRDEVAAILIRDGIPTEVAHLAAAASGHHIGRARHLARDEKTRERRYAILNLAELIGHGDQAFQAVTDIVKSAKKFAIDNLAPENEREIDKLRLALGMGAKGKGAHKALGGAASHIKELEAKQKKRETRAIRDVLDMQLVDLMGLYRDALMIASQSPIDPIHPDMEGLARELSAIGVEGLIASLDGIQKCREAFSFNVRPEAALDAMVGRLRIAAKVS
ncbi:DNA polymerase III subunit delta' [Corynebacterium sp. ES2775-CONJ]|uniref:DNA polymerase III subunit delta' n=1 Tax=Corynebacterium sp. ES2775-CONJ TaxID=2974029 RepID=UPI002167EDDC|nr:DNA polymerase III subunit delta' [Corynebacterium sp. ES2775-CONJ]MCS4490332.1 DNA polymerase III subunit delta' [Corynebacterium sp. ES2775-CONJ]